MISYSSTCVVTCRAKINFPVLSLRIISDFVVFRESSLSSISLGRGNVCVQSFTRLYCVKSRAYYVRGMDSDKADCNRCQIFWAVIGASSKPKYAKYVQLPFATAFGIYFSLKSASEKDSDADDLFHRIGAAKK